MSCRRFVISGKVQGVWFRASTRQQAERLGITGHAINLADGRVEVLACGSEAAVHALGEWLWQGPELASVGEVLSEEYSGQPPSGFATG